MSRGTTREVAISKTWTQISAGTYEVIAQFYTVVDICRADEMPSETHPALRVKGSILTFDRTDKVWVRVVYEETSLVTIW
ncbi:hypothetical protein CYG68_03815 [Morganella morganii]|uniref:Uncharacterized protein n=1 Tax=Morganella morganii TaxID=582 RepID=A0A8I0PWX0_MORMO|nr:hypothetical protein [Morganella morganii]MBE8611542.1 hypothetical protein [Morganella morganii]